MTHAPELSVLMVAYNPGCFLLPALRSVLVQTVSLEVVLVDNVSTDGAVEAAVAQLADARLRVLRMQENGLHPGGINAGLRECRGEFVALMDHDDVSHPTRLARQLAFLKEHPETDAVACLEGEIDSSGRPTGFLFCLTDARQILPYSRYEMPFPTHNLLLRRPAFEQIPWRAEFSWAADFDFMQRVAEQLRISILTEVLYFYRSHPTTVSQSRARGLQLAATLCRLVAARRRAGRPEMLDGLTAELALARSRGMAEADMYETYAQRFLSEGFWDLALVYARRAWRDGRHGAALKTARGVFFRALGRPKEARWLARIALVGPAHALGVKSHPPLPDRGWRTLIPFRQNRCPHVPGSS